MGASRMARSGLPGSIKTILAASQNSLTTSGADIAEQPVSGRRACGTDVGCGESEAAGRKSQPSAQKLNPQQTNYNPPAELDPVIYFENGAFDRHHQQHHDDGERQADRHHHGPANTTIPKTIISMANGAYLDTKNNILTMSDGTKIDTVTGLKITV